MLFSFVRLAINKWYFSFNRVWPCHWKLLSRTGDATQDSD